LPDFAEICYVDALWVLQSGNGKVSKNICTRRKTATVTMRRDGQYLILVKSEMVDAAEIVQKPARATILITSI